MKALHAIQFDGSTFGMEIETDTIMYKNFKNAINEENAISYFGGVMKYRILTVHYLKLAPIMREAHWLVSQGKYFDKITIKGLKNGEEIYVKYDDALIDFRKR